MDPGLMRALLRVVKAIFRPAVNAVSKQQLRRKIRISVGSEKPDYAFTKADVETYVTERFVKLPRVAVVATGEPGLVKATINGRAIFWPSSLPTKDLSWLYHEIFDTFASNPSSYDHPGLDYENRSWVMDAGAAEGYFSVFALERSRGTVISVEPLPLMKTALTKTLALYAKGKSTIVVGSALGDEPGWSDIQVDYEHVCDSKLTPLSATIASSIKNSSTERVPVTTIDKLADQYALGPGGLIKMDIEGYEMAALSGATNILREHKPALAIAVYHEMENAKKCADIIRRANPSYKIEFRGYYGYFSPPRPYMLFAV